MYLALGVLLAEKHLWSLLWMEGAEDCLKMPQKTQQKITPVEKKWMATSFSHYCRPESLFNSVSDLWIKLILEERFYYTKWLHSNENCNKFMQKYCKILGPVVKRIKLDTWSKYFFLPELWDESFRFNWQTTPVAVLLFFGDVKFGSKL